MKKIVYYCQLPLLLALLLLQATPIYAQSADKCRHMTDFRYSSPSSHITMAEWRENYTPPPTRFGPHDTTQYPPHCHIEGALDQRTGVAGADSNTMVHVHRGILGDTDPTGGKSDLDSTIHRWQNPVAKVVITVTP